MSPSERRVDNFCLAKTKCPGFIPLWLAVVRFTSSFFLKGRCMKKFGFFHKGFGFLRRNSEWLFAQQSLMIWILKESKGSTENRWGTWVQVRRCCLCKSPFEDHLRQGIWWKRSNPIKGSLPIRGGSKDLVFYGEGWENFDKDRLTFLGN